MIAGLGAVILTVALAYIGPILLPAAMARDLAASLLGRVLGVPVTVAGRADISLLPTLRLDVDGISAAGGGTPDRPVLFDIPKIRIEARTLPILSSQIHIRTILMDGPVLRLSVDRQGAKNWREVGPVDSDAEVRQQRVRPDYDWGLWNELKVDSIRVRDGRAVFRDDRVGRLIIAEKVALSSSNPVNTEGGPGFLISGGAVVNGERLALKFETGPIRKFLSGDRLPVVVELDGAPLNLRFQGGAAKRQFFVSEGVASVRVGDLSRLEKWLGQMFAAPISGGFEMTAKLGINGPRTILDGIVLQAGDALVKGDAVFSEDSRGASVLNADFKAGSLNLTPLFTDRTAGDTSGSMIELLTMFAPRPNQGTVKLRWNSLDYGGLRMGAGRTRVVLGRGQNRIDAEAIWDNLYGGRGQGRIRVGVAEGMTSLRVNFEARKLAVGEMLQAVSGAAPFSGSGDLSLQLFSVGGTVGEVISALRGNGEFNIRNGEILQTDLVGHLLETADQTMPFSQMVGSFSVSQGIIRGEDLLLRSPRMSLIGQGGIDLARNAVSVDLRALETVEGAAKARRLIKPFRVEGTLSGIEITAQ